MGVVYYSKFKIQTQSPEQAKMVSNDVCWNEEHMDVLSRKLTEDVLEVTTLSRSWTPTEQILGLFETYPTISIEVHQTGDHGQAGRWHWYFTIDGKQEIYSLQDAIDEYSVDWAYGVPFHPKQVVIRTRTKSYGWDGSVKKVEYQDVLFPPEEMPENIRLEYEKWCENPEEWEAEHNEKDEGDSELQERQLFEQSSKDELPF